MGKNKKHPFKQLESCIKEYQKNRLSFDVKDLQDMRERIALLMFYLSDSVSLTISNYDKADWERKRGYAQLIEDNKWDKDGNKNTVSVTESLARIANEDREMAVVEAIRQKERVKVVMSSTQQILNAIASRISQVSKN